MADYRPMSFLPTIKCSQCSEDIAISHMGDHICGGTGGESTPPPDTYKNFEKSPYDTIASRNVPDSSKPNRAMPPRVDTSAANRTFFRQESLTPVSLSPSRSISPLTPNERSRSPFGRPTLSRSSTAPISQPSPELLSASMESGFHTFPIPRPLTPVGAKPRMDGSYGGLGPRSEDDPMYAPISPRMVSDGALLKRMNTIAPGPFGMNNRRKASDATVGPMHQRQKSTKDISSNTIDRSVQGDVRPNTSAGHSRTATNSSSESSKSSVPRPPRKNGYDGFGPPSMKDERRQFLRPEDRSQTFPQAAQIVPPRRPSETESRVRTPSNGPSERRPSAGQHSRRQPSVGPDLSRPLPPRGTSFNRPAAGSRLGDAPPLPTKLNLAEEFGIGNPYHTPSTSQSSDTSGYSETSVASSRSSPPKSIAPRARRNPSDTTQLDVLMSEVQASMNELQPRNILSNSPPSMDRDPFGTSMSQSSALIPSPLTPDFPKDLSNALTPIPSRSPARALPPQSPDSLPQTAPLRQPARPTTSKGNCKGCLLPIKGKSISSADGRLTGRYHKECFVCATCSEPFQTATFYVINDAPYCERHYHKLNGSTCATCDRGIEGQYLESERKQKFHPACLNCADCRRSLRNDYFEMNGRVYCERDAFRRMQRGPRFLGPGAATNKMERRTTRLMMM